MNLLQQQLSARLQGNGSFHPAVAALRLVWSASSLGQFKRCPRYYLYSNLLGYTPRGQQVDLAWGSLVHEGLEQYSKFRTVLDFDHQKALRQVVSNALHETWDSELGRPQAWPDKEKNRVTLVRALVWYLDQWQEDPLQNIRLASGEPAVELEFNWKTDLASSDGQPYIIRGRLDRIVSLQGHPYIVDFKTTRWTLDDRYFGQFALDTEFTLYAISAGVVWQTPVQGLIVDALQVGATFVRSQRQPISRAEASLAEWYEELDYWLRSAEDCARRNSWPQNDKACRAFGRQCEYYGVCSRPPSSREAILQSEFIQRPVRPGFGQEVQEGSA